MTKNAIYAQSGGVTAVINVQAATVIETAKHHSQHIGQIFAGRNGLIGILREELIDIAVEPATFLEGLVHTPSGAFGSCRYKLNDPVKDKAAFDRLVEVFKAHNVGYFFYNGGNDSQDTTNKISTYCQQVGYPVTCIGIPKTIDNDLPYTDCCPGFGSVAKYVAISTMEAALDVAAMAESSTKVFIMEVMGRHAGWIAAASGLAQNTVAQAPHIILFPEVRFDLEKFQARVKECVKNYGFCVIVASEGVRTLTGAFLSASSNKDAFGHTQLGGVAPKIAALVENLGYKTHWAVCDYLQRSARHIGSSVDVEQAYATAKAAVEFAIAGKNAIMPIILRESDNPYKWSIGDIALDKVANVEKKMPEDFISKDQYGITDKCRAYLEPLIFGEAYPPYVNGLPQYVKSEMIIREQKLPRWKEII